MTMNCGKRPILPLSLLGLLVFAGACGNNAFVFERLTSAGTGNGLPPSPTPAVSPTPEPSPSPTAICDPFGGGHPGTGQNGLVAELTYRTDYKNGVDYPVVADFLPGPSAPPQLVEVPNPVFLSRLNKPTSPWEDGFLVDGKYVTTAAGDTLVEWFALLMKSRITLGGDFTAEGDYELALLSDDGAVLSLDRLDGTGMADRFIDNDGTHQNRLRCNRLHMVQGQKYPIALDYFQGPRNRIAMMFLWRQVNAQTAAEPLCTAAASGDFDYFTDETMGPSAPTCAGAAYSYRDGKTCPTPKFKQLIADGFRILDTVNFILPEDVTNVCL